MISPQIIINITNDVEQALMRAPLYVDSYFLLYLYYFAWCFILFSDGVLEVAVLETLENDRNEMQPAMLFPSTPVYDFISVATEPYNIYIEEEKAPAKYLTITGNKQLVFQEYSESSK